MLLLLTYLACKAPPAPPPAPEGPPSGHLTLLHTNDMHSHYLPEVAEWIDGRPKIGGFERLDAEVQYYRKLKTPGAVLLLDGGDLTTGTPLADLEVNGVRNGAMLQFMGLIGYDAWVLGNHEFDKGLSRLSQFTAASPIPVLSANLYKKGSDELLLPKQEVSHIFTRNGVRIGVIGATTEGLATLMNPTDFAKVDLRRVKETVQAEANRIDPQTDLIVLLTHIGLDDDRVLAQGLTGVDLIVGGHSHTRMGAAEKVGDVWIMQAGSYIRSMGVADLVVADDKLASFQWNIKDLTPESAPTPARPEVTALVQRYQGELDQKYGQEISSSPGILGRSYHHESALGDWITDALVAATGADIAFYNGGGLRADLDAGPVTLGDLYNCFPFGNEVQTFTWTGQQLQTFILQNMAAELDEKRGYISFSGMAYTWKVSKGAPELVSATVGGKPLDPKATYRVATTSYIAEQWQKHLGAPPTNLQGTNMDDLEAAVALAKKGPIVISTVPRAKRLSSP